MNRIIMMNPKTSNPKTYFNLSKKEKIILLAERAIEKYASKVEKLQENLSVRIKSTCKDIEKYNKINLLWFISKAKKPLIEIEVEFDDIWYNGYLCVKFSDKGSWNNRKECINIKRK